MEAAGEAVRDEMECIAVCKEVESALVKAIEDLRFLGSQDRERRDEQAEWCAAAPAGAGALGASAPWAWARV